MADDDDIGAKARELFPDPAQRLKALELHKHMLSRASAVDGGGRIVIALVVLLSIAGLLVPLAIGLWRWALS